MKIADDFDAIRQRARELAEEKQPVLKSEPAARIPGMMTYVDSEADVSDHYFPIGMIVA